MNECMQQSLEQKNTRENGIEKADLEIIIPMFDIIRKKLMRINLLSGERYRYKWVYKSNIV